MENRYLLKSIVEDLKKKMVFLGGPRQVGKTTLGLYLIDPLATEKHPAYLSWDDSEDRSQLIKQVIPSQEKLLVIDEIHKYLKWRNLIKGLYDKNKSDLKIIVTGSAKLDYFLKGGDTLLGRYHYYRLHPFSLNEFSNSPSQNDLQHLLKFGGFPEPLFTGSEKTLRRWHLERSNRVIYDDLKNLSFVKDITLVEHLVSLLPERVGSPLSIEKLRILLDSTHPTINKYIQILERLYYCFRIPPFGTSKVKAVKKEQKLYLWDWSEVEDTGYRFENMVASHLLKFCHFLEDTEGFKMELRFIRNVDGKEIDFVVLKQNKPIFAVESKTGERALSSSIGYYKDRLKIPKVYQVHLGKKDFGNENTTGRVLPFITFCQEIKIP